MNVRDTQETRLTSEGIAGESCAEYQRGVIEPQRDSWNRRIVKMKQDHRRDDMVRADVEVP
jgi:hypothetical protein